jgi:hypothetical protein
MFAWILKSAIISVIFIFLIHHLIKFFKNMLTTPKIKDFVTRPAQKYEKMFNAINSKNGTTNLEDLCPINSGLININEGESSSKPTSGNNMKEELKQYLKLHLSDDFVDSPGPSNNKLEGFDFSANLFS